jgi:uncharacterized protein (DUF2252 family)
MEGTREDRASAGRALRKEVPRTGHAAWDPASATRDPINVLEDQGASRIAELVPVRHGRMASSPFAFFRGAAAVMALDLASTPATGLRVQACGDAHVSNFGEFATPERNMMFDINDFDETLPGPWEWDVKRLCASLQVAALQNGFSPEECERIVLGAARSYRERLAGYTSMRTLELFYDRISIKDVIAHFPPEYRPLVKRDVKKAHRKNHLRAVAKLTRNLDGRVRFVEDPPLIVRLENTEFAMAEVMSMIDNYRLTLADDRRSVFDRFDLVDVARKVVGVGSVGTHCWIALLEGPNHPAGDPLVLQVKEAQASVLEPYVGESPLEHHGLRVVSGQRLTQASSDMFLGWSEGPRTGRQYYVRQLWDTKGQGDPMAMDVNNLAHYGSLCAWALARAHARTGDAVEIAGYLGTSDTFERAIAVFSARYAITNERDYRSLLAAMKSGRVEARMDA